VIVADIIHSAVKHAAISTREFLGNKIRITCLANWSRGLPWTMKLLVTE
jgi:hypothetical protein